MTRTGTVISAHTGTEAAKILPGCTGTTVIVRSATQSSCGASCPGCPNAGSCGGSGKQDLLITADNSAGAHVGDTVEITASSLISLISAFISLIIPLIAGAAGFIAAKALGAGESLRVICAVAVFAVAFAAAAYLSDRLTRKKGRFSVTKILASAESTEAE